MLKLLGLHRSRHAVAELVAEDRDDALGRRAVWVDGVDFVVAIKETSKRQDWHWLAVGEISPGQFPVFREQRVPRFAARAFDFDNLPKGNIPTEGTWRIRARDVGIHPTLASDRALIPKRPIVRPLFRTAGEKEEFVKKRAEVGQQ